MKTATITFANGRRHTCRFSSAIESPWRATHDPPYRRVPHPQWPQYLIFEPIPGTKHRSVVRQYWFGTVYDEAEFSAYRLRGLV